MNERLFKILEESPFVYHYTSIEALFAILEGYRHAIDTGYIPFIASCIYKVNDVREMTLGYETVKRYLPQYEKELIESMNLADVYKDCLYEDRCIESLNQKPVNDMILLGMIPYIISFSRKRDYLPMWSMYGYDCKGVCLKFNVCKIIESLIDNAQVDYVFYDRNTDNYVFDEHFALLYDWDLKRLKENMTIEEKIEELSILCTCVSPFIKTNDWAFENEFRIVKYKHYGPKPNHEFFKDLSFHGIKETKVEPYVYCNIGSKALEEVLLGPLTNYDVVEHILRKELEECLLNDVEITPSSIAISK